MCQTMLAQVFGPVHKNYSTFNSCCSLEVDCVWPWLPIYIGSQSALTAMSLLGTHPPSQEGINKWLSHYISASLTFRFIKACTTAEKSLHLYRDYSTTLMGLCGYRQIIMVTVFIAHNVHNCAGLTCYGFYRKGDFQQSKMTVPRFR